MKPASYNLFDMLFLRYPQLAGCRAQIFDATDCLIRCYRSGGKLLICGNGGSASDAAHIVGELMKSFILSRPVEEKIRQKLLETDPEARERMLDYAARLNHAYFSGDFVSVDPQWTEDPARGMWMKIREQDAFAAYLLTLPGSPENALSASFANTVSAS